MYVSMAISADQLLDSYVAVNHAATTFPATQFPAYNWLSVAINMVLL